MEHIECDVLVVGSGAAGLRAAISAKQKDLDVCVISKQAPCKATCTMQKRLFLVLEPARPPRLGEGSRS